MYAPLELFRSVETIWAVWLVSALLLSCLTAMAVGRFRWRQVKRLFAEEDGAAYTLSYVMVIPIYVLLMCLIAECTLLLMAKIGTVYAAYAGARTAIVWQSIDEGTAQEKTLTAAVHAMVPFAGGMADLDGTSGASGQMEEYLEAYREYAEEPASSRYMEAKYRYASGMTTVTSELSSDDGAEPWESDIIVTVEYRAPFHIPMIARLLGGEKHSNGLWIHQITSKAALQNEAPQNEDGKLGISYASSSD